MKTTNLLSVMFLHGFGCDPYVWHQYQQDFAEAAYPDLTFDADGNPLLPVLETDTILVGWSMGGMVALEMLRTYPAKVKGLLLCASAPTYAASPIFPAGKTAARVEWLRNALDTQDVVKLRQFQHEVFSAEEIHVGYLRRFKSEMGQHVMPPIPRILCELKFLENYRPRPLPEAAAHIPVTVLHGTQDAIIPYAATQSWQQLFPQAKITSFDAGHAIPYVHKDAVVKALNEMLALPEFA